MSSEALVAFKFLADLVMEKQSENLILLSHEPITITSIFNSYSKNDENTKTNNGFIIKDDRGILYLVTTANSILKEPKNVKDELPNIIKCSKNEIEEFGYSKFFNVAICQITNLDLKKIPTKEISEPTNLSNVKVSFIDINSGEDVLIKSSLMKNVSVPIKSYGVTTKLMQGCSGSALLDEDNKIVGMISNINNKYKNMTMVIPIDIIKKLLNRYSGIVRSNTIDGINNNIIVLDNEKIYPGLTCLPINSSLMEMLPDINSGEIVEVSRVNNLLPMDIITSVEEYNINKENRLSNLVLDGGVANEPNSSIDSNSLSINKLKPKWRDSFGSLPRVLLYKKENEKYSPLMSIDYDGKKQNDNTVVIQNNNLLILINNNKINKGMNIHISNNKYIIKNILIQESSPEKILLTLDRNIIVDSENIKITIELLYPYTFDKKKSMIRSFSSDSNSEEFLLVNIPESQYKCLIIINLIDFLLVIIIEYLKNLDMNEKLIICFKEITRIMETIKNIMPEFKNNNMEKRLYRAFVEKVILIKNINSKEVVDLLGATNMINGDVLNEYISDIKKYKFDRIYDMSKNVHINMKNYKMRTDIIKRDIELCHKEMEHVIKINLEKELYNPSFLSFLQYMWRKQDLYNSNILYSINGFVSEKEYLVLEKKNIPNELRLCVCDDFY